MELIASINQSREEEKEITREGQGDLDFNTKGQIRKRALHLIEEDRQQLEQDLQEQVQQEITQKNCKTIQRSEMPIFKMYYNEPMVVL